MRRARKGIDPSERAARMLTMRSLRAARDKLLPGSVEAIFVYHAGHHCMEQWLSDSYGYEVRITGVTDDGYEITRA